LQLFNRDSREYRCGHEQSAPEYFSGENRMSIETCRFKTRPRRKPGYLILWTILLILGLTPVASADVVADWNNIATNVGPASGLNGVLQSRVYAMAQAAVHDALNAIDRRYEPYAYGAIGPSDASPEAAVVTAAYSVLWSQFRG
jgi:hypothetical protein